LDAFAVVAAGTAQPRGAARPAGGAARRSASSTA